MFGTINVPAIQSARTAVLSRAKWITAFVAGWALNIAAILGMFGDLIQGVFALLFVLWFVNIYQLRRLGLLPFVARFWRAVLTGR